MRLQARSEPGIKTMMDEKQSKNDEFSFLFTVCKLSLKLKAHKMTTSRQISLNFDFIFKSIKLMFEKYVERYSLNSGLSFYVCTTKEDIILNVCKNVLNEVQTQYQYWNNFIHLNFYYLRAFSHFPCHDVVRSGRKGKMFLICT